MATIKSIEQKAKRYDEAIERAKDFMSGEVHYTLKKGENIMCWIFPELRESEDEKIRQLLLRFVKYDMSDNYSDDFTPADCIAWLEKQGEKTEPIEGFDTEFERQISHLIASTINKEYEYTEDSVKWASNALLNYAKHELEKQGEQKFSDIDNKFIRMRETKPKDISEFLDRLTTVEQEFLWEHIAKVRELDKEEQKSADKTEPKFKVGDWVVYKNDICQIVKREEGCNKLVTVFGIEKELVNERNLSTARLWTTQDAKDGDVLSYRDGQWIFIYKEKIDDSSFYYHALYSTIHQDLTINDSGFTLLGDAIVPATKEQRDNLMKAMADAGYTFDFEKKELRKIEQKTTWSENDEYIIEKLFCLLDNEQDNYPQLSCDFQEIQEIKDWLKSLKDRVGCEANFTTTKEWNEEDEDILNTIINHFEIDLECTENDDIIRWLKSLKPQNKWKPSDEQMKVLKELIEDNNQRYFYTLLRSLYDQLKILKG